MPEQEDFTPHGADETSLAAALRALPAPTPPRSAWPDLAQRLAARRRAAQRRWLGFGLAAGVSLAVCVGLIWRSDDRVPPPTLAQHSSATQASAEDMLIARNRQLEEALRRADARGLPLDGASALASAEIEDLIGMVDLELSQVHGRDDADALWQQRLDLMQQLAEVRQRGSAGYATEPNAYGMQPAAYVID
jgi:hypothetical protein